MKNAKKIDSLIDEVMTEFGQMDSCEFRDMIFSNQEAELAQVAVEAGFFISNEDEYFDNDSLSVFPDGAGEYGYGSFKVGGLIEPDLDFIDTDLLEIVSGIAHVSQSSSEGDFLNSGCFFQVPSNEAINVVSGSIVVRKGIVSTASSEDEWLLAA